MILAHVGIPAGPRYMSLTFGSVAQPRLESVSCSFFMWLCLSQSFYRLQLVRVKYCSSDVRDDILYRRAMNVHYLNLHRRFESLLPVAQISE